VSRFLAKRLNAVAKRTRTLALRLGRPQRLRIYLGQGWLSLCLVEGRFQPKIRIKAILPSSTSSDSGTSHGVDELLVTLDAWLRAHPVRATIDWIIGIDHVRYLLLPWDERLSSNAFCRSLAAALFAQQCSGSSGEHDVSAYELRFGPLYFGRPRAAAAIPNNVLTSLTAFASMHGCRTRLIAPMLSVVWNNLCDRLKSASGSLALFEGQRLLLVGHEEGKVVSISLRPYSGNPKSIIAAGATHYFPPVNLTSPANNALTPPGLATNDDVRLAYALCGLL
jgi:hypothetical protein